MLHDNHSYQKVIRKRGTFFRIGLIISLVSILWAFQWKAPIEEKKPPVTDNDVIVMEHPPRTLIEKPKRPQIEKPVPPDPILDNMDLKEIDDGNQKEEKEFKLDLSNEIDEGITEEVGKVEIRKKEFYMDPEVMPVFPGGMDAMHKYIQKNFRVPEWMTDVEETIHLNFIVDENGDVRDVKVLLGGIQLLNREAKRVVEKMPAWSPGKQGNQNVAVIYTIPINIQTQ